jgi:hypothetical protein
MSLKNLQKMKGKININSRQQMLPLKERQSMNVVTINSFNSTLFIQDEELPKINPYKTISKREYEKDLPLTPQRTTQAMNLL